MKHSFFFSIVAITIMVVALSCSKGVATTEPALPALHPPSQPRVIFLRLGTWEKIEQDLYINDHPNLLQYSELTGKKISVYATVNYGVYTLDEIISTRPMPCDNGLLWASISGTNLTLYWRSDDITKSPSFNNLSVRVVLE